METYSIRQTANLLGIKVRTAREWLREGKLTGVKDESSKRWRISEDEIKRIKEARKNDNEG